MNKNIILGKHTVVITAFVTVIIFISLSAWLTYLNAQKQILSSLQLQALAIAHSIETSLKESFDLTNKIFRDLATTEDTGLIAYTALYDNNSTIMFHSDDVLVGTKISDTPHSKLTSHRYFFTDQSDSVRLFIIDMPVNLHGFVSTLRVALHTNKSMQIMREAHLFVIASVFIIIIATGIAFLYIKAIKKSERLEEEVAAKRQLAIIGEMSAVLAHEIRNPLGSIKGFAQYILEKSPSRVPELEIIINESARLEKLSESLLNYCKPLELHKTLFNLQNLINDCITLVNPPEAIHFDINIDDVEIFADKDKLKQALVNILQNACQAITGSGEIKIKLLIKQSVIELVITDTGIGMNAQTLNRVFEPFFTTKAKGTGLGLAICERIIKAHGGNIAIESLPYQGTTVTIQLPMIDM